MFLAVARQRGGGGAEVAHINNVEGNAQLGELGGQCIQGAAQVVATNRRNNVLVELLRAQQVNRPALALRGGRAQRRVIEAAKVVAKPDQRRHRPTRSLRSRGYGSK